MFLTIPSHTNKQSIFDLVRGYLVDLGFTIIKEDNTRPWGGFFVIDEGNAERFIQTYFPDFSKKDLLIGDKLSPKILVVEPGKRLSWQYHNRRAEIWKLIGGAAKVVTSDTDIEDKAFDFELNGVMQLRQGQRHRLVGISGWGVIAEIWQHTDPAQPSDEDDIIRVQDDFGR